MIGDRDGAIADFTEAIQRNPKDDVALSWRALAEYQLGRWQAAVDDYTRELEIDPKHDQGYYERGRCRLELKDFLGAILDFTSALKLRKVPDWFYWRGRAYYEASAWTNALEDLSETIKREPYNASAYLYRGLSLLHLGKQAKARADLDRWSRAAYWPSVLAERNLSSIR
jgi:tetratricopeptide (TPR) repeat protein